MLSIEEIQLLIEKLKKLKHEDFQKLIDSNLKILEDLAEAVDANNKHLINSNLEIKIGINFIICYFNNSFSIVYYIF